jgi:hypothetical protein
MKLVQLTRLRSAPALLALFDAGHGQVNWAQTGFPSRELHTNFAGLTEILCRRGFQCQSTKRTALTDQLATCRLLIIPPPTGTYDARRERWRFQRATRFTREEIRAVLGFLRSGGRLLAFGYRFGDSFTETNLGDLCLPLGGRLNDDAVIDVRALRQTDPLHLHFETAAESLWPDWARPGVITICWRPVATFTLQPDAIAWPLALSTGGSCLSFDRTLRRLSFESLPIAVGGHHGAGRFALFGGPHLFESSPLGLLSHGDNTRFLHNTLGWLLSDAPEDAPPPVWRAGSSVWPGLRELSQVEADGQREGTIASVERVLRQTGVLKALSRAKWMP